MKGQYIAGALARVQRAKFFPDSARDPERSGSVVQVRVEFSVSRSGSLNSVSASSYQADLASAAKEAVRRAAPFGAFPDGLPNSSLKLSVTLEYRLR